MNDRFSCRALYRGKRLDDGEWIQGYFVMSEPTKFTKMSSPAIIGKESGIAEFIDPATVGQCTGLRDKNGTLIFEGDLVRFGDAQGVVAWGNDRHFGHGVDMTEYADGWLVEWGGEFPQLRNDFGFWAYRGCEVVGNVHDAGGMDPVEDTT